MELYHQMQLNNLPHQHYRQERFNLTADFLHTCIVSPETQDEIILYELKKLLVPLQEHTESPVTLLPPHDLK